MNPTAAQGQANYMAEQNASQASGRFVNTAALGASTTPSAPQAPAPKTPVSVLSTNQGQTALANTNTKFANLQPTSTPGSYTIKPGDKFSPFTGQALTADQVPGTTITGTPQPTANNQTPNQPSTADTGLTLDEAKSLGVDLNSASIKDGKVYVDQGAKSVAQQNYETNTAQINSDYNSAVTGIQNLMQRSDAASQGILSAIAQTYAARRAEMQDVNARDLTSLNTSQIRSGANRFAPEVTQGIISSEERASVMKLSSLDAEELKLTADATQAASDKQYAMYSKLVDQATEVRKEKQQALKEYYDQVQQTEKDRQAAQQKITDGINAIAAEAAKNGASQSILKSIGSAKSVSDAVTAAGNSLQTGTGTLGDYLQYKRDTLAKGLVPLDYQTYKDQQDAKAEKLKVSEAYSVKMAQNQADTNYSGTDKVQQKLEQQYRQVLSKEFSSRTGSLGIENGKVNQANHLNSLFSQYLDPKTGNYNIPTAQYAELVMGLANLISPTGATSDSDRQALMSKTAAGDLKGAIQYITGSPQTGNTQEIIKNLIDSVDRQAQTAQRNREAALQNMRDQAPTDLEQSRVDKLNKSTEMVGYEGQDRISKSSVNTFIKQSGSQSLSAPITTKDGKTLRTNADLAAFLSDQPGATPQTVEAYLKAKGIMQ